MDTDISTAALQGQKRQKITVLVSDYNGCVLSIVYLMSSIILIYLKIIQNKSKHDKIVTVMIEGKVKCEVEV